MNIDRPGKMVQLISVDPNSQQTFLTDQGTQLLEIFPTEEMAFVVVGGSRGVGKSFFCDKVLNLAGVKGNNVRCGLYSSVAKNNQEYGYGVPLLSRMGSIFSSGRSQAVSSTLLSSECFRCML